MNSIINKIPLFRTFLPFSIGLILFYIIPAQKPSFVISELLFVVIFLSWLYIIPHKITYSNNWIPGLILTLSLVGSGYFLTFSVVKKNNPNHYMNFISENSFFVAIIIDQPEEKEKTYKTLIKIKYVINQGKNPRKVIGKTILFIRKDSLSGKLRYGDEILFRNCLREVQKPLNPGQFDYRRYLSFKQIYQTGFCEKGSWIKTKKEVSFSIAREVLSLRMQIIRLFKEKIPERDEQTVAASLLVGYQTELSDMIKEAYSSTGAIHVLAVSGMHVGVIFIILNYLFFPLKRLKRGNFIHFAIITILLSLYAILTGLSPSVNRAVIMFSFVLFGKNIGRMTNVYSSIILSAFVLMIYDPYVVTQVGFQLSYAAVLGIIYIHPRIFELIPVKNRLLKPVWSLISVSISAQISTFPLGFLYFNQFPVYFMVSNLLVIPASNFVIYFGVAYLISYFSGLEFISEYLLFVFEKLIWLTNHIILKIRELPNGLIQGIYTGSVATYLIYFLIISICSWIFTRKKEWLYASLGVLLMLQINLTFQNFENHTRKRMIVYHIPNHTLIGFFDGRKGFLVGDSMAVNDSTLIRYHTYRDVSRHGVNLFEMKKITTTSSFQDKNLVIHDGMIQFYKVRIFILTHRKQIPEKFDPDIIILSGNPFLKTEKLSHYSKKIALIADASNKNRVVDYWEKMKLPDGFVFRNIPRDGAFEYIQN